MNPELRGLQDNVRLAIEQLGPMSGVDFGLNRESVEWVEGFIERQRQRPDFTPHLADGLTSVLGSFLGQCVIEATGGTWAQSEEGGTWGVRFPNGAFAFPFSKVGKQFDDGVEGGESITSFYDVAVNFVATGKLHERRDRTP